MKNESNQTSSVLLLIIHWFISNWAVLWVKQMYLVLDPDWFLIGSLWTDGRQSHKLDWFLSLIINYINYSGTCSQRAADWSVQPLRCQPGNQGLVSWSGEGVAAAGNKTTRTDETHVEWAGLKWLVWAGLKQTVGYLGGALTGSEALPVEVLAAGFAFAGGEVVGGIDGPLQVHPAPCCHGNNLSLPLGVGLWQRHLSQEVLHGTFTPLLQNSGTFRTLHKGLEHFFTL